MSALHRNLGVLHTQGYAVPWATLLAEVAGPAVALPTYAFQRQRYWLEPVRSLADVAAAGLSPSTHPLLGAATTLAEHDGVLFTTRLSLADHPWLADHTVFGQVLVPGTAVLELALAVAQAVGGRTVTELMQSAPLVLTPQGAMRLQLSAGRAGWHEALAPLPCTAVTTRRPRMRRGPVMPLDCSLRARIVGSPRTAIRRSSSGRLRGRCRSTSRSFIRSWHRRGWAMARRSKGWSKPGVTAACCTAAPCFPTGSPQRPAITASTPPCWMRRFTSWRPAWFGKEEAGRGEVLLPFAWSDVTLQATGASELRVRMTLDASDGAEAIATLDLFDVNQQRVARVGELRLRRATAEQVRQASQLAARDLYRIDWQAVVLGDGVGAELTVGGIGDRGCCAGAWDRGLRDGVGALCCARWRSGGPGSGDRGCAARGRWSPKKSCQERPELRRLVALRTLQELLSEPRLAAAPVVFVTRSAVGTGPDDLVTDLAHAPLWGLVRSARSEHPDRRLRLVDLDPVRRDHAGGVGGVGVGLDSEPELALREERWLAPRLVSVRADDTERATPVRLGGVSTVLVTGGVGELGRTAVPAPGGGAWGTASSADVAPWHGRAGRCGTCRDAAGARRRDGERRGVRCGGSRGAGCGDRIAIPAERPLAGVYSILPGCSTTARSPH